MRSDDKCGKSDIREIKIPAVVEIVMNKDSSGSRYWRTLIEFTKHIVGCK